MLQHGAYSQEPEEQSGSLVLIDYSLVMRFADIGKAAMGGTYEFATLASANLREKDDSWNPSIGGFLAGSIMGLRCWSTWTREP